MSTSYYITKSGGVHQCERTMQSPKLANGYWWHNETPLGQTPQVWIEQPVTPLADDGKLFGYDFDAFMAKQYRCTKHY